MQSSLCPALDRIAAEFALSDIEKSTAFVAVSGRS